MRLQGGGQLAINLVLVFLGGEGLAVDEQVFGAEKPDSLGPVKLDRFQVADLLDVGGKDDLFSIHRGGGEELQLMEFILHGGVPLGQPAIFEQGLFRGINDDQPAVTIEQGGGAVWDFLAGGLQAHHRGNLQGTRHDRAMGSAAADIGAKTQGVAAMEQGDIRGRQIFRDQNARLGRMRKVAPRAAAHQIIEDAGSDIANVGGAFLQIRIVDGAQSGLIFLGELMEGGLGIGLLVQNQLCDRINEGGVFQDEEMGVENTGVLGVQGLADLALHFEDLLTSFQQRLLEPFHLNAQL